MQNETNIKPIIGKEFPNEAIKLIERATNSIKIIIFDWRWYPSETGSTTQLFNQSILRAKNRGVEVKAICNMQAIVDVLNSQSVNIKKLSTKRLLHTKLLIVDDKDVIIGSHNYTQNAFNLNYELSVLITNFPDIERLLDYFNNLFN